jgi:hypothetical protein
MHPASEIFFRPRVRGRRGGAGWLACALATAALAGCGSSSKASTITTAAIAHVIETSIAGQHHLHTTVHCPPRVPRRPGFSFACAANLDVGTYPVLVTVTSASGRVRYQNPAPLVVLDTAKIQRAIARSILQQRSLRATVACPKAVIQQAGLAFRCTAIVRGRSYPFEVTQVDGAGHVRYVGER